MNAQSGSISIHAQNIMPIIKRWLYSDKDIFIREMVSNGCDAITKYKLLHPDAEDACAVTVTVDEAAGTLTFTDNGIGMTAEEVEKYINQVAFSSAEEFLKSYTGEDKGGIIGHFGLGFYSAFMVARRVTIETRSYKEGAEAVRWTSEDGMTFEMTPCDKPDRGTVITLEISDEEKEFLSLSRVREVLRRYCGYLAVPVYLAEVKAEKGEGEATVQNEGGEAAAASEEKGPERINDVAPLWLKAPKDCTPEEYTAFYKRMFDTFEEPLFYIHLNVDYPFNLKGILYFPHIKRDFGLNEGQIKLFSGQVFVADNIKEVIPEFLMLLRGVIDCPDLPLNVSRSFLQNDGYVKKLSAYITRKVADRLVSLFKEDRAQYQTYWDDIHPFVKYGCIRDAKFFESVKDTILFKTAKGDYVTLTEYLARNEGKKVYYANDLKRQAAAVALYTERGRDVVLLDNVVDFNFISFMEYGAGLDGVTFARVDADVDGLTADDATPEDERKAAQETLEALFREASGDDKLEVQVKSLADDTLPAMMLQEEQGRRFTEMSRLYGQDFKMPEHFTLVLNGRSAAVRALAARAQAGKDETATLAAQQMLDLARMSTRPLESDEITAFLARSNKLLGLMLGAEA